MPYNMPYGSGINYMQPLQFQAPVVQPQQLAWAGSGTPATPTGT